MLDYFETVSVSDFPLEAYYFNKFGYVANRATNQKVITDDSVMEDFNKMGFEKIWESLNITKDVGGRDRKVYAKDRILVKITIDREESGITEYTFVICYKFLDDVKKLVDILHAKIEAEDHTGKVSLITSSQFGLSTTDFKTKVNPNIDIELHYGEEFAVKYKVLLNKLNSEDISGISLLHGDMGTGKSTVVKLLTKHVKNKEIIFVPPYLAENICGPEFIPFLIEKKNCILIIEDAERVLLSRESGEGSSSGVSNLLNISDGILGDVLNINIICTFNTKRDNIDKALLRPGRLVVEHSFKALSTVDANKLIEHVYPGESLNTTSPMTLAEIYNIKNTQHLSKKETPKIGFNNR